MAVAPLRSACYSIEALAPLRDVADSLAIEARQGWLVSRRTSGSGERVASVVTMWHPGHLYQYMGQVG